MRRTEWHGELALPVDPGRDHVRGPADAPLTLGSLTRADAGQPR